MLLPIFIYKHNEMAKWIVKDKNGNEITSVTTSSTSFTFKYPKNETESDKEYIVSYEDIDCNSETTLTVKSGSDCMPVTPPQECTFTVHSNVNGATVTWYNGNTVYGTGSINNGSASIVLTDITEVHVKLSKNNYNFIENEKLVSCDGEVTINGGKIVNCETLSVFSGIYEIQGLDKFSTTLGGLYVEVEGAISYYYPSCNTDSNKHISVAASCSNYFCSNESNSRRVGFSSNDFGSALNLDRMNQDGIENNVILERNLEYLVDENINNVDEYSSVKVEFSYGCGVHGYDKTITFKKTETTKMGDNIEIIFVPTKRDLEELGIRATFIFSVAIHNLYCSVTFDNLNLLT